MVAVQSFCSVIVVYCVFELMIASYWVPFSFQLLQMEGRMEMGIENAGIIMLNGDS